MIYDCPQCGTPQEAGQTVCPHCQAHFDGPVPEDAIIPPKAGAPQEAISQTEPIAEKEAAQTVEETASPLVEVKPPAAADPMPQPSFSPPYLPPITVPPPMRQPFGGLTRMLLFAFPIVLVLVLGSVYYVGTLNTGVDTSPVPPPAVPVQAALPAPAPVVSPVYMQGSSNTNNPSTDPRVKKLAGRWEAKSGSYYVFSGNGTGLRGNTANPQKDQSFLWGLVQNRLMLYMDKNETLRFNPGPNDNTLFLGAQTGHYVQYTRSKT